MNNENQNNQSASEQQKPAVTPDQAKPAVVKPGEAPSQKPADATPKGNA